MERICEYCKKPFEPKRTDALYCSHSCRQLAYVLRKATENAIEGLNNLTYRPDTSNKISNEQEPSIKMEIKENYPSTKIEKNVEPQEELTDKVRQVSTIESEANNYPSITESETVKKDAEITVNTNKNETPTQEIKTVNTDVSVNTGAKKKDQETKYTEYESPFIMELAELTDERDNLSKLSILLFNKAGTSAHWISLRYKCLVECMLTFSEMEHIDLDDLKEVCNAFTSMIRSRSFNYLPACYPYTNDIQQLRDTIKNLCIDADENKPFILRFKKETKLKMLATRWELANYVPKINFSQLDFKE